MKDRITEVIRKTARKNYFEDENLIQDLINTANQSYDGYRYKGCSVEQSFRLAMQVVGNLHEVFQYSKERNSRFFLNEIIHIGIFVIAICTLFFSFVLEVKWLMIGINFFLLIVAFLLSFFLCQSHPKSSNEKKICIKRLLFCILSNIALVMPLLFITTWLQYYPFLGMIILVLNIVAVFMIDISNKILFMITIPAVAISVLGWINNLNYLTYLEISIFIVFVLIVYFSFYLFKKDLYHYFLSFYTLLLFIIQRIYQVPYWAFVLVYGLGSLSWFFLNRLTLQQGIKTTRKQVNFHFSIFFFGVVIFALIEPLFSHFQQYFSEPILPRISYIDMIAVASIFISLEFIHHICYYLITNYITMVE